MIENQDPEQELSFDERFKLAEEKTLLTRGKYKVQSSK